MEFAGVSQKSFLDGYCLCDSWSSEQVNGWGVGADNTLAALSLTEATSPKPVRVGVGSLHLKGERDACDELRSNFQ